MPSRHHHKRNIRLINVQREHKDFEADFNMVYSQFLDSLSGGGLIPAENAGESGQHNLVPLIMAAIRLVERLAADDKGASKKQLVMALITRIIQDSAMSEQDKVVVQVMLESLGPSIIDGLVDADHGRLLSHGLAKLREKCKC